MCISDIELDKKREIKTAFVYLLVSVFCILFGAVYEYFSHEVYSFYMIYAFAFPLFGGTLPFMVLFMSNKRMPEKKPFNLYNSGIAALTVGSIVKGVLDIYGTTNRLISVYWITGVLLCIIGVLLGIIERRKKY